LSELERSKAKTIIYRNKIRLNNPHAVQKVLARTINILLDSEQCFPVNKAHTVGYLCNIMLSSFEVVDFENRLKALEKKYKE